MRPRRSFGEEVVTAELGCPGEEALRYADRLDQEFAFAFEGWECPAGAGEDLEDLSRGGGSVRPA